MIKVLVKAIVDTGIFDEVEDLPTHEFPYKGALEEMVCENDM